jgi:predicted AAA+ superfamily ATPase
MKRKIDNQLADWRASGAQKPLIVVGARQVGKTFSISRFCAREFESSIELNLMDRPDVIELFREVVPIREKIARLELLLDRKIDPERTILFFDEAQESEDIIAALKFFAEADEPYKIICAGSLLGVKINRFTKSFPVGKVEIIHLHPMDFEEYLLALGQRPLIDEIRSCFNECRMMSGPLHEKCLKLYRNYLCVGGMPEAVADMVAKNQDILLFNTKVPQSIYETYLKDMNKYIVSPLEASRIEAVYTSVPAQLGNKSDKFQYSAIRRGARGASYSSALDWLASSEMVYRSTMVAKPERPLKGFEKDGFFKLYLNDTGLLLSILRLKLSEVMLDGDYSYKGIIAENYVASQLVASDVPLHYWRSDYSAEVDFLIDTNEGIMPVEVKAGSHKRSASLLSYREQFSPICSVKLSTLNFGLVDGIRSVPLYAAFCLAQL